MNETRNETDRLPGHRQPEMDSTTGPSASEAGGRGASCTRCARRSGAPAVASVGQSGPECCTVVIYLHTAVHRLWVTPPGVTPMPAVTAVRAPTHRCPAGAHRQVGVRIPAALRAEATSRGPVFRHAHGRSACRWIACSNAVASPRAGRPPPPAPAQRLQYCANARPEESPFCSRVPQFRCAHRLPACGSCLR